MKKILVAYYSESGSTKEIAVEIGKQFTSALVDVLTVQEVDHLAYDIIVLGSPNRYGKPATELIQFLKKNEAKLTKIPIAFFFSCMDCYRTDQESNLDIDVYCDSNFQDQIRDLNKLSSWEKSHVVSSYLENLTGISKDINIQSIAFFKGRLDFKKLSFFNALVMRLVCLLNKNIKKGDYFKSKDIIDWSYNLILA